MKAKHFILLLSAILLGSLGTAKAQGETDKRVKPLIGLWQYVEEVAKTDGTKAYIGKKIYKTITEEKTYFVMIGVDIPIKEAENTETQISTATVITQQGDIEMTSESTYLEYINNHYLDKRLNNTISSLRFRFNEENPNILYLEYNLGDSEAGNWISEVWLRVLPLGAK